MNKSGGRILCVDYGTVRLGIALSDITKTFAQPKNYIKNNGIDNIAASIAKIAKENDASIVVIGLPKKLDGRDGSICPEIQVLKKTLEETSSLEIVLWDERLSTVSAENVLLEANISRKKRKEKIDSVAAAIILQNYLDYLNRNQTFQ